MSSQCLNGGQFILSQSSNASYCQCDTCFHGVNCADRIPNKRQVKFNTDYIYLIIYLTELCLSLLNNLLSLEVFLGCKRVRRTNIGVYLILYSIISIVGSVLLVVNQSVQYFKPYPFANNQQLYETFDCFLKKSGDQVTQCLCLSLSALVAFERGLIICFNFKMNATRWRSVFILLFVFSFTAATSIPMLIYRCEWDVPHKTPKALITSTWLYTVGFLAGVIYVVGTLLVLIKFVLHIYHYGTAQESRKKIFFKLLRKHLFILIPPITYLLCNIPYQIWYPVRPFRQTYLHCGISTVEYIFKVLARALTDIPTVITWLIFVYPSNVYMTEFYTNTWSGRRIRQILDSKCFLRKNLAKEENGQRKHFYYAVFRRNTVLPINCRGSHYMSSQKK